MGCHEWIKYFNNAVRMLFPDNISDDKTCIYKYVADNKAVSGIVEGCIWATSIKSFWVTGSGSNPPDTSEGQLVLEYVRDFLKDEKNKTTLYYNELNKLISTDDPYKTVFKNNQTCVVSLSVCGDSKYLWENYAKNDGYIIEFNKKRFLDSLLLETPSCIYDSSIFKHAAVEYNKYEHIRKMEKALEEMSHLISKDCCLPNNDKAEYILELLIFLSIFYKKEEYANEQEYRVALTVDSRRNPMTQEHLPMIYTHTESDEKKETIHVFFSPESISKIICANQARLNEISEQIPSHIKLELHD